jgi:hypothetical protein
LILITSIAPNHKNRDIQQHCINSWVECGFKPISVNHESEKGIEKEYKNIEFFFTQNTKHNVYGKHYPPLESIASYGIIHTNIENSIVFITNSDIEVNINKEQLGAIKQLATKDLICLHRVDYDTEKDTGKMYMDGIDGFFVNRGMLKQFIQNDFVLGQCHWDFYIPYKIATVYRRVVFLKNRFLFHKKHPLQYDANSWKLTSEIFAKQENLSKFKDKPQHLSSYVYRTFMKYSKTIEI